MSEPFGRQPKPVIVRLIGEAEDVAYWRRELMRKVKGELVQTLDHDPGCFKIYPNAVND